MNLLPPLYSYTQEGWRQQKLRGEQKLGHQITKAVRQAFVVIVGEMALDSIPVKPKNKDYKNPRKNTASAFHHRVSPSPRLSLVDVTPQIKKVPVFSDVAPLNRLSKTTNICTRFLL